MKSTHVLMVAFTAVMLLMGACGPAVAPTQEVVQQPVVVEQPTLAPAPTAEPPPAPAEPQYAPFCQAAPASCEAPTVEMRDNKYCEKKQLYAIMVVPAGTTYKSLDPGLTCIDQVRGDGTINITCKPEKELWSYELEVCNSACAAPSLVTGTGQCPDGYGFDTTNQCCAAQTSPEGTGCTVYRVDVGACAY